MIDVFPLKLSSGPAYVLTAEVVGVFTPANGRFDRCDVYVNGMDGPLEVMRPACEVSEMWQHYLIAEPGYDSVSE